MGFGGLQHGTRTTAVRPLKGRVSTTFRAQLGGRRAPIRQKRADLSHELGCTPGAREAREHSERALFGPAPRNARLGTQTSLKSIGGDAEGVTPGQLSN